MAQVNQANKKIQQSNQIADEIKAEIERIGNCNPYIETDRELEFYHWLYQFTLTLLRMNSTKAEAVIV